MHLCAVVRGGGWGRAENTQGRRPNPAGGPPKNAGESRREGWGPTPLGTVTGRIFRGAEPEKQGSRVDRKGHAG